MADTGTRNRWFENHVTQKENEKRRPAISRKRGPTNQNLLLDRERFFATHAERQITPISFCRSRQSMSLYNDVEIPVPANATQESCDVVARFRRQLKRTRTKPVALDVSIRPKKIPKRMMKNYYRPRPKSTRDVRDDILEQLESPR